MSETTAIAKKPGWKTSEFWLTTATLLMGQFYASGVIGDGGTVPKIAAFVCSALGLLGYQVARAKAKAA